MDFNRLSHVINIVDNTIIPDLFWPGDRIVTCTRTFITMHVYDVIHTQEIVLGLSLAVVVSLVTMYFYFYISTSIYIVRLTNT